jgi:histidinol dehydrogenase
MVTGPGNTFVATAKRLVFGVVGIDMIAGPSEILVVCDGVFGVVGIDMIAGPSEILVVCDGKTDPDWIAMDLFSQAEHDEEAQSILVSPEKEFIKQVKQSIERLLEEMPRKEIIKTSLENRAAIISVTDMEQAIEVANHIAPEHLELSVLQIWSRRSKWQITSHPNI